MPSPHRTTRSSQPKAKSRNGRGAVPAAIKQFARQIAEQFWPEQIILFGSHARGQAGPDSDVDILVVKSTRDELGEACRIRLAIDRPFPLDLIVRTPQNLRWRLEAGDWFLREVMSQGRVLYSHAREHAIRAMDWREKPR